MHSGPGPDSLRSTSAQFKTQAQQVQALADNVRGHATAIDQHWVDGRQRAGQNVNSHADWLDMVGAHLTTLGSAANQSADHADTVISQTPKPEEFADLRHRLQIAIANFNASHGLNPAPVTALMGELAQKNGQAIEAHQGYYAAAAVTTGIAPPPPPLRRSRGRAVTKKRSPTPARSARRSPTTGRWSGHGGKSGGIDPADDPGTGVTDPASDAGVPVGRPMPPPSAVGAAQGVVAEVAGALVGAGSGMLGQAAGGLHSLDAAPMSALSRLSGATRVGGMPQVPQRPVCLMAAGHPPDPGSGGGPDFGTGSTTPAGGGGVASGAGPVGAPAVGGVITSASPATGLGGPGFTQAGVGAGAGMGGGYPMMPPFFGGGARPDNERGRRGKDKRVVLKPVPNTEPVFGAVERPRRRRAREQESSDEEA